MSAVNNRKEMAIPNDIELLANDSNDDGDGDYVIIPREEHDQHIENYFVVAWDDADNKHHEGIWHAYEKSAEKDKMKELSRDRGRSNIRIVRRFRGIVPDLV